MPKGHQPPEEEVFLKLMVPRKGLEPSRPLSHWHLKPARLPIPPPGHWGGYYGSGRAVVKLGVHSQIPPEWPIQCENAGVPPKSAGYAASRIIHLRRNCHACQPPSIRSSPFSEDRVSSDGMWSGRSAKRDYRIRVGVRRPEFAGHLQPLGQSRPDPRGAGQRALPGVGRRPPRAAPTSSSTWSASCPSAARRRFDAVQAKGAEAVARAAARSARGWCMSPPSAPTRIRPRAMPAPRRQARRRCWRPPRGHDHPSLGGVRPGRPFHQCFAALARISPMLPLIGGGMTRFQPVFVGDVATAIADAVDGKTKPGATYELGGPEVHDHAGILEVILRDHRARPACWFRCRSRWRASRRCSCNSRRAT